MSVESEERRVVIEAIATLVHMRDAMAELILQPAGIPRSLYQPFLACAQSLNDNTARSRVLTTRFVFWYSVQQS
jgi:hypothetical protein